VSGQDQQTGAPSLPRASEGPRCPSDTATEFEKALAELGDAAILDGVHDFLGRFVAYPSDAAHRAHALWIAHTHLMDAWESTPRIAFLSPEPGSGKTRALEITELLVPNPIGNCTPSWTRAQTSRRRPTWPGCRSRMVLRIATLISGFLADGFAAAGRAVWCVGGAAVATADTHIASLGSRLRVSTCVLPGTAPPAHPQPVSLAPQESLSP
jgi:hypothetical protein